MEDGYHKMTCKGGVILIEIVTFQHGDGESFQMVHGYEINWPLKHCIEDGCTFERLIVAPPVKAKSTTGDIFAIGIVIASAALGYLFGAVYGWLIFGALLMIGGLIDCLTKRYGKGN